MFKSTHRLPRFLRPLGEGFWPDVVSALATLAGVALGVLVFENSAGFVGAVIGVTAVVIGRAMYRGVKRHRDAGPPT